MHIFIEPTIVVCYNEDWRSKKAALSSKIQATFQTQRTQMSSGLQYIKRRLSELGGYMAYTPTPQVTPATDININFKDSTLIVSPTAAIDGFDGNCYDTAVLITEVELNNPEERLVEIPLPFPTKSYTASMAVISKGEDEYSDRVFQVTKVKGNAERFVPYLQKMGVPQETLNNKKELKKLLEGFRVGLVNVPQGTVSLRIEASEVIMPDISDPTRKTYKFLTYAPLPSFVVAGGASMRLTATFKQTDRFPRTITQAQSNPYGDAVSLPEPTTYDIPGERIFHWEWRNDPVIDWTIVYN